MKKNFYTAREAAIEVLKKTEQLLKSWDKNNKAKSEVKMNEFSGIPQPKQRAMDVPKMPSKQIRPLKAFLQKRELKKKACK